MAAFSRWRSRRRRLKVGREGKYFIAITMGVGLAAVNTGNNLLFLLLGWMCSVIVASGVLSELTLRRLEVSRRPAPRIHAGRPFLMGITVRNPRKRTPSFSIEIEDLVAGEPLDKRCYFLKIPAGKVQHTSYRHTFPRRGKVALDGFRVSTKFPFALFRKSRDVEARAEVLVYPAVHPVTIPPPASVLGGDDARPRAGRRGEFFGLREARAGDDHHDIHWRSSAHKGRLMLREYEDEAHRRAAIWLDNGLATDAATDDERDALEKAVSLAASLALAYLARGYAVRLVARGASVRSDGGPPQELRILRALALLETVSPDVPFAGAAEARCENLLVVRRGGPPTRLANVNRRMEAG